MSFGGTPSFSQAKAPQQVDYSKVATAYSNQMKASAAAAGTSSTIGTSALGDLTTAPVQKKTLFGQ